MTDAERSHLRQRAMLRLSQRHANPQEMDKKDLAAILHDLELYQVELEVQNEELRRARTELEVMTERYRDLYEFAPVGYLTADARGRIRQANLTLTRMTGRARDHLLGRTVDLLFAPQDRNKSFVMRSTIASGPQSAEMRLHSQDLPEMWVHVEMVPQAGNDVQGPGFRMTLTDISAQKRAQDKQREFATELEQSNTDLEQFAFVASHDLQEPLRMIISFLTLLKQRAHENLDDKSREFMEFAVDGASRMSHMVQDLLEYSRIGRKGQQSYPTESGEALKSAIARLGNAIEESSGVVTVGEMPTVKADPAQLAQVFQNLIGNALKFRSGDRRPEIHVSASRGENEWLFKVADNGIGMQPDQTERIFQIFQRLHTREQYPGTGIGLAICKRIVERLGGRIWAESSPGKGSTFCFTIPD